MNWDWAAPLVEHPGPRRPIQEDAVASAKSGGGDGANDGRERPSTPLSISSTDEGQRGANGQEQQSTGSPESNNEEGKAPSEEKEGENKTSTQGEKPPSIPFTDVTEEAGITFVHDNAASGDKLLPETMGGGTAFFDYDEDGDPDLLLMHSSRTADPPVVLYANDGKGHFEDVTAKSGLKEAVAKGFLGMGVTAADVDGDGWTDLYLTAVGGNRFLRNREGRFIDATAETGLAGPEGAWGTGASFFDAEGDGDLDLVVANYVTWSPAVDRERDFQLDGIGRAFGLPQDYPGAHPLLFIQGEDGGFVERGAEAGLHVFDAPGGAPLGKALAVAVEDVDGDGLADLFVANDTTRNFFFHNQGGGRFEEAGELFGLAYSPDGRNTGAMGVDWGDLGGDGRLSFAVGNFAKEVSSLYRAGDDPAFFLDEALAAGLAAATRPALTFAVLLADFDLDGRLDLLQVNGHVEPDITGADPAQSYRQPPQLFWNAGLDQAGRVRFLQVPDPGLGDLPRPLAGRGAASADVDGDGDLDLVLTQTGGPAVLLRNDQATGHHWLRVRLEGLPPNRDAIGAQVEVKVGDGVQRRTAQPARGYLSSVEPVLTFGLGEAKKVNAVTVTWPGEDSPHETPAPPADEEATLSQVPQQAPAASPPAPD